MKRLCQYFTVNDKQSISLIPPLSDLPWEDPPNRREIFNQQGRLLQKTAWNHLWIWADLRDGGHCSMHPKYCQVQWIVSNASTASTYPVLKGSDAITRYKSSKIVSWHNDNTKKNPLQNTGWDEFQVSHDQTKISQALFLSDQFSYTNTCKDHGRPKLTPRGAMQFYIPYKRPRRDGTGPPSEPAPRYRRPLKETLSEN